MNDKITTRKYQPSDARALADIYYYTIHNVNTRDYSEEQVNAWAPSSSLELDGWQKKWSKLIPIVALSGSKIVGFAEFEPTGHIDCFYVHHEFQGKGVGSTLMNAIEAEAKENKIHHVYAEVSLTAKTFFERKGFYETKKQNVIIRGCELTNFVMVKNYQYKAVSLRQLKSSDIPLIVDAFQNINWPKSASTFENYLQEQLQGYRLVWIAHVDDQFAGYVTLTWRSQYEPFANSNIPEIMDLNVLPPFRTVGVGSKLLEAAERIAATKSDLVGIGVGLYGGPDGGYGAAQRLYVKCGYIPDGKGVAYNYKLATPGDSFPLDDDLVLWFTKILR